MKVQTHNYLEPPFRVRRLCRIKVQYDLLTILAVAEVLCSFRLVLERKTGKVVPESSRVEFLEKFLSKDFALSDAGDNTCGSLNRGGIVDLSLLRTLLVICKISKSQFYGK